ncbi:MAG: hypothetical protein ACOYJL_07620 [Tractidigestivibacter sp.]|jgi:hypothetical protein|uniref:zinc dependent phospholipase C family protein n=1 Tax=Tractidigestivibacter sp. TaxID=2847320 RepID=UPI003D8CB844
MPALLTHDFFARDASVFASDALPIGSLDERDAFALGCQGPDPLFYLEIHPLMAKWAPIGNLMHEERPASLLASLRIAADKLPRSEQSIGRAYLAGFSCHWLLDATIHPFVYWWQKALTSQGVTGLDSSYEGIVHAEVERDLDEAVLFSKVGKTIEEYRPFEQTLQASRKVLSIVDKMYFYVTLWAYGKPVDPTIFSVGTRCYRRVMKVIYSPRDHHRELMGRIERMSTGKPYSRICALSHRARRSDRSRFDNLEHATWENPFSHQQSDSSFWDLYERALARAPKAISAVMGDGFDFDASCALTDRINFEGEQVEDTGLKR